LWDQVLCAYVQNVSQPRI